MPKQLTDDMLKWTLDIEGKPAINQLNKLDQSTRKLEKTNKALNVELQKMEANGKKNTDEYRKLEAKLKENNVTLSQSRAKMSELRKEVGLNNLTAAQLSKRMRELRRDIRDAAPNSIEWKNLNKELTETQTRYNQVRGGIQKTNKLFGAFKTLAPWVGFGAAAAGLKSIWENAKETRAEFSKYEAVLKVALGSQKAANDEFFMLKEFAATTPFQLNELTGSFVKLTNYGLKPNQDEMRKYGDLAASVGKGFDQLVEAVADATQFEFERLKEFGIRSQSEGDKIKFTFKGITTEVDKNAESVKNYLNGLGGLQGVAGSMEAISKTIGGAMSNAGDATDSFYNAIGKKLEPGLVKLMGTYGKVIGKVTQWVEGSPTKEIEAERDEVNALVSELLSAEVPMERRNAIYERLNEIAPDVIKGIDQEKINTGELLTNLQEYNTLAIQRIALKKLEIELDGERDKLADLFNKKSEAENKLWKTASNDKQYENILLDETLTREEKLIKVRQQADESARKRIEYGSYSLSQIEKQASAVHEYERDYNSLYNTLIENEKTYQEELKKGIDLGLKPNNSGGNEGGKTPEQIAAEKAAAAKKSEEIASAEQKAAEETLKIRQQLANNIEALNEQQRLKTLESFDRELTEIDSKYNKELEAYQQALDKKQISQDEFNAYATDIENARFADQNAVLDAQQQKQQEDEAAHQQALFLIKQEYGLLTQEEIINAEIAAIQAKNEWELLSEEEKQIAIQNIRKKYGKEELSAQQEILVQKWQKAAEFTNKVSDIVSTAGSEYAKFQDLELQKVRSTYDKKIAAAEGNAKEQARLQEELSELEKSIAKKKANAEFIIQSAQIVANTAQGISKAVAQSPTTGGLPGSAIALAIGAIQEAVVIKQRQIAAQAYDGRYDVIGKTDGRLYKNVPYSQIHESGIPNGGRTTLVNEHGGEMILTAPHVRNLQLNHPAIMDAIHATRVPQRAEGKYDTTATPAPAQTDNTLMLEMLKELRALRAETAKPKRSYVVYTDIEDATDDMDTIYNRASGK